MKKFRTLLAVCFLCVAATVSAQFTNNSASSGSAVADTEGWNGLRVSYNNFGFDGDFGKEFDAINGIEVGYVQAFSILNDMPIFLETGASLSYVFGDLFSESGEYYEGYHYNEYSSKRTLNMFSVIVPVNVGYKFAISEELSMFPYLGVTLKGNIKGTSEYEYEDSYGDSESSDVNVFDDDDMDDEAWDRFQLGWQIGTTLNYKNMNIGLSYGADLMELGKDIETNSLKVTIGCNF